MQRYWWNFLNFEAYIGYGVFYNFNKVENGFVANIKLGIVL